MLGDNSKDKWPDDTDNLELIAQQESNISSGGGSGVVMGPGGSGILINPGGVGSLMQQQQLQQQQQPQISDIDRSMKNLNGYHEDILEALRNASGNLTHRNSSGNIPPGSISEEMLRKTLAEYTGGTLGGYPEYNKRSSSKSGSKENICDSQSHVLSDAGQTSTLMHYHRQQQQQQQPQQQLQQQSQQMQQQDDDDTPSVGPLRIRNLEDLIRQLEHHSSRHMSPSGSEDIRMSETEADRHYRLDSSAACSESSHG